MKSAQEIKYYIQEIRFKVYQDMAKNENSIISYTPETVYELLDRMEQYIFKGDGVSE